MEAAIEEGRQSAGKPIGINKEPRPGNGKGVVVQGIKFTKADNWMDLLLVLAYQVQTRGKISKADAYHAITHDLNSKFHTEKVGRNMVSDGLEALRKQDFIAIGQDASGLKSYTVKRIKFNCNPPIMNVKAMIEELKTDTQGALIIERFENEKGLQPDATPRPAQPALHHFRFGLLTDWYGSHIWAGNPALQHRYFNAGRFFTFHATSPDGSLLLKNGSYLPLEGYETDDDVPLMFERIGKTVIATHRGCILNSLAGVLKSRPINDAVRYPEQMKKMFGTNAILLPPEPLTSDVLVSEQGEACIDRTSIRKATSDKEVLGIVKRPIHRDVNTSQKGRKENAGCGPKDYEIIKAGTILDLFLTACTVNFVTPVELKEWVADALRYTNWSMSPARGTELGNAELLNYEYKLLQGPDRSWKTL